MSVSSDSLVEALANRQVKEDPEEVNEVDPCSASAWCTVVWLEPLMCPQTTLPCHVSHRMISIGYCNEPMFSICMMFGSAGRSPSCVFRPPVLPGESLDNMRAKALNVSSDLPALPGE